MRCKGCGWFDTILYGGFCLNPEVPRILLIEDQKKGCNKFVPSDGSTELPLKGRKSKLKRMEFKVKGSGGNQYKIYVYTDGVRCTCPQFTYRCNQKRGETCKHIDANIKRITKYKEALK